MGDFVAKHFDRFLVLFVLVVFLGLLVTFHSSGFGVSFLEQSANLALGCLLGLVKGQVKEKEEKND